MWLSNSPDCNYLDYYFWGVIEGKVNKFKHASLDDIKAGIIEAHTNINGMDVSKTCRLEVVVANNGSHIECIYAKKITICLLHHHIL